MENLYLIYVNLVGKLHNGRYLYEFIFSKDISNVDGEDWDQYPASRRPEPPYDEHIDLVGKVESELTFDVVQNSDTFAVFDAVDGVISLAWENIDSYETYPDHRLCFKFGDTKKEVENKLYEKDLILTYKK